MRGIWRMVAGLLLIAVAAVLPGTQTMALSPSANHAAGCHEESPAVPVPAPTSFRCCVSGHDAAIPVSFFSLRLIAAQWHGWQAGERFFLRSDVQPDDSSLAVPSSSPPPITPLRI